MISDEHDQPRLSVRWFGRSDKGPIRKNNEDAFLGLRFDAREVHHLGKTGDSLADGMDFVFAVSDGMGGANAGELASRIAVEKITAMLPRSFKQAATGLAAGYGDVLGELFAAIHKALVYVGGSYDECRGMEATLSLCWLTPGWMWFAHIGDSRVYHVSASEPGIRRLSQDDTYVGWLFRTGQINEREARAHPRRNVLQKSLGGGNQFVDPQVGRVALAPGDKFLLCTDGLHEGLRDDRIEEILRDPGVADAAQRLVDDALKDYGRDNTTALVVEVG